MAWQSGNQYGDFQFQFGSLSPIVEAALQRKKQQQAQQQQMMSSIGKMASQYAQGSQQAGPGQSDVSNPGSYMSDAVAGSAGSADGDQYRITSYGPESSSPTPADYNETIGARDNQLRQGDVAVSPDMRPQFPLGSHLRIGTSPDVYTVSDFTNPRLHRRVDIWNGQDMGNQPVYGYSQGGVVPLPENAEGVLGWRTWPDFNARRGNESLEQLSNVPAQHFASGGVASFTDPYPERKSQYVDSIHLADVSGMAGVIAHQRLAQQQMQQEQMQQAYQAATKLMEQQRTDAIGKALIANSPEIANDPRTQAMMQAGAHGLEAYKIVSQQQADEADAQRQATGDWWTQHDRQARVNHAYGKGEYGEDLPQSANTPQTYTDDKGQEWRQGAGGHWYPMKQAGQLTDYQQMQTENKFSKLQDESDAERKTNIAANKPGVHFSKENEYNALQKQLGGSQAGSQTGTAPPIVRQDQLPNPQTAAPSNPPAVTGIAASYEEAAIGQHFRAPDGSVRIKQN
jgi:hypothetical protein